MTGTLRGCRRASCVTIALSWSTCLDNQSVDQNKLESWKQIAAYLSKSERTVRRWERDEGLPVHKHRHLQKGTVWAYKQELDQWQAARCLIPQVEQVCPPPARKLSPAVALAALATILAAGTFFKESSGSHPPPGLPSTPLTVLRWAQYGASFSPDRRQIAFFWQNEGERKSGIYLQSLDSTLPSPLVTGPDFYYSPAWSPDGRTVAFLTRRRSHRDTAGRLVPSETWLEAISPAGGKVRRLARLASGVSLTANHAHLSWAPDSKSILAPLAGGDQSGIYRLDARDGTRLARLSTAGKGRDVEPVLSPDGRRFLFLRRYGPVGGTWEEIYLQELNPGLLADAEPVLVNRDRAMNSGMAWAPDGKSFVVCKDGDHLRASERGLYRISPHGGQKPRALHSGPCSTVTISPPDLQGRSLLAFGSPPTNKVRIWKAKLSALDSFQPFAPSAGSDNHPSFSPDGAKVAFVSTRSGQHGLWVANADGTGARPLAPQVEVTTGPAWSPGSDRILMGTAGLETSEIVIISTAPGNVARLDLEGRFAAMPSWSPDGRQIYFWSGTEQWQLNWENGQRISLGAKRLVAENRFFRYYLLYDDRYVLIRSPRHNPAEEEVLSNDVLVPVVSLTDRWIYFIRGPGSILSALPVQGPVILKEFGALPGNDGQSSFGGFSVSPDDKTIVWAFGDNNVHPTEIRLIREFR